MFNFFMRLEVGGTVTDIVTLLTPVDLPFMLRLFVLQKPSGRDILLRSQNDMENCFKKMTPPPGAAPPIILPFFIFSYLCLALEPTE